MDFSLRLINILEDRSFVRAIAQLDNGGWPQSFLKTVLFRDATENQKISLCMLILKAPNLFKQNLASIYPTIYSFNPTEVDSINKYLVKRVKIILNITHTNEQDDYNDNDNKEQEGLLLLEVSPVSFAAIDHFPNIVSMWKLLYLCSFDTTHVERTIKYLKPFLSSKGLLREFGSGQGFVDAQLNKYLTGREYSCTLLEKPINNENIDKFAFAFLEPIKGIHKNISYALTPSLVGYNGRSLFLQHNFDQSHTFTGTGWRMQHRAVYREGKNTFAALSIGGEKEAMQAVIIQDLKDSDLLIRERFFRRPIILIDEKTLTIKENIFVQVATPIYIKYENISVTLRFNIPLILNLTYIISPLTLPTTFWELKLNAFQVECSQSYTVSVNSVILNSHYDKTKKIINLGSTSVIDLNPVANGYALRGSNFSEVIVFDHFAINLSKLPTVHSINGKTFTNSVPQICLI